MQKGIGCVAAIMCAVGIAGEVAAAENNSSLNNSSLAPLIPTVVLAANEYGVDAANKFVLAAATSLVYDKKGETCKEVVGPNTKYEPGNLSNYNVISPELDAVYSFVKDPMVYDKAEFDALLKGVQVTVVVPPKHGKLLPVQVNESKGYFYMAEPGYFGVDKVVFSIKFGNGKTILLNNFVSVVGMPSMGEQINACPDTPAHYQWMREHLPEIKKAWEDMTSGTADDYLPISPLADLFNAVGMGNSSLGTSSSAINLSVADLPGSAIGQTTNSTITLDTNAAGNGWFIDTTPADNSEFLPTSDPNVWMAKADSAAAGKMDMLSVLLHEYGHALGIEHSADPSDFMNATLQPGERRLPTADELALMQQLIAKAKGEITSVASVDNSSPANAPIPLDLPLGGSLIGLAGFMGRRYTQYEIAANAAFTTLDTASGWNAEGAVDIAASTFDPSTGSGQTAAATLREVANSQTRLNQVFMLGDNDRYLTFTLSGSALDYVKGLPEDAFQVALLDASTGDSLLGSDGQTRTDAFLSLQADGTQNAASGVSFTVNADGSRTYRVDLSNVPKNIAANLSFDLIGFGASDITSDLAGVVGQPSRMASSFTSHITVSDVRVSGLPQLHDDSATLLEDGTFAFDPLAQARVAGITSFTAQLVGAPAHGVITVNADGTCISDTLLA